MFCIKRDLCFSEYGSLFIKKNNRSEKICGSLLDIPACAVRDLFFGAAGYYVDLLDQKTTLASAFIGGVMLQR